MVDIIVRSSRVSMYAKYNLFEYAIQLFDEMPNKDMACWNTVISCYHQSGKFEEALRYFGMMRRYEPDSVTITTAISSCVRHFNLERRDVGLALKITIDS